MGFKAFDVPTMIAVSGPWVDENKDMPLLLSQPLTVGLVPILAATHNGLLQVRVTPSESDAVMRMLSEQAFSLDSDHDERYRVLHTILTGWAAASSDESRRRALENIRDTLLPDGLSGTLRTYLSEAGNVELAVTRMTPEMANTLKGIVVEGRSLFQLFNEWTEVGRKLGDVERARARTADRPTAGGVTAADVQQARYKWIRAVNALCALLALGSGFPEEDRIRILQPLRTAEAKFAKKRSAVDPTEGLDPTESEGDDTAMESPAAAKT